MDTNCQNWWPVPDLLLQSAVYLLCLNVFDISATFLCTFMQEKTQLQWLLRGLVGVVVRALAYNLWGRRFESRLGHFMLESW